MAFTPVETSIGAVLIQLATTNFYWQRGQTIGFSSAIFQCFSKLSHNAVQIVTGMLLSSVFVNRFLPQFIPPPALSSSVPYLSLVGFIVGLGTKLGQGCTSGHMIAGLSRLRLRSLVATASFASTAMAVVYFTGAGASLATSTPNYLPEVNMSLLTENVVIQALLASSTALVYLVLPYLSKRAQSKHLTTAFEWVSGLLSGFLFGVGLHIAGMLNPAKTIGFLALPTPEYFDPSLALIMVFAVLPNIFVWRRISKPLLTEKFNCATSTEIPLRMIFGSALFGIGWGLLGVCPGPGLLNTVHYPSTAIYWLVAFLGGQWLGQFL